MWLRAGSVLFALPGIILLILYGILLGVEGLSFKLESAHPQSLEKVNCLNLWA